MQRPQDARKTDPGMPSSHASSLAYLSVYMAAAWRPEPHLLASSGLVLAALLVSFCKSALHTNVCKNEPAACKHITAVHHSLDARKLTWVTCHLQGHLQLATCMQIPLRVILGYHSVPQVIVGVLLGTASAATWYGLGYMAAIPLLKSSTSSQGLLAAAVAAASIGYLVLAFRSK